MNETHQITADLRVVITTDEGTEDPRSWNPAADVLKYHVPYLDRADDLGDCQTKLGCVFTIVWGNHGNDHLALKVAQRYKRMFDVKEQIAIGYFTGYSQGDWYHAVAVTPEDHGTPESTLKVLADWSFGRVYTVTLERRVAHATFEVTPTGYHGGFEIDDIEAGVLSFDWEEVGSIGDVYFESEFPERDEILEYVRGNASWDELTDEEQEAIDNTGESND